MADIPIPTFARCAPEPRHPEGVVSAAPEGSADGAARKTDRSRPPEGSPYPRPVLAIARGGVRVVSAVVLALVMAIPAGADPSRGRLRKTLDRIAARPALSHAFWGIEVRSLESGRALYSRNADKAFRPASTLKLLTTAAALDGFGPEARFRTTLETTGRLDGWGRVLGDVFLVGRGDPSLSGRFHDERPTAVFEQMADALGAAGVRRIEGRLVGHEGAFAGERRGADWSWEDLTWGYGAEVSALSFNDNVVRVRLTPGERPGDPAVLHVSPSTSFVPVVSAVVTSEPGTERDVALEKRSGSNRVLLSGTLPPGEEWEGHVAVEDPALFATTVFAEVLETRGIAATGGVATTSEPLPETTRVLAAHEGATVARLIAEVNRESLNLHAELLLRQLGRHVAGEGTVEKGLEALAGFLDRLGVPRDGFALRDGAGLARSNVLTPTGLASLLVAMDRHGYASEFRGSLAGAGEDGTLEDRMRGTPAEGRVRAKTGTLRGVSALAGYVTTVRGERLAFAVIVNNHADAGREAQTAIDEMAAALATAR